MTVQQISRMSKWLQLHGHTSEEVIECINYIAKQNFKNEKSGTPLSKKEVPDRINR